MGLIIPTRRDVVASLQSYVRTFLPELDPSTQRRSYIGGKVKALGSSLHDYYVTLKRYGDNEPFPQTASRPFLLGGWWVDITKLAPNPIAAARGKVVFEGDAGTIVPLDIALSANNVDYKIDASVTIVGQSVAASSLTRSGSTAIFETAEPHHLATGMELTISGATPSGYNGTFIIKVTAADEFTFDLGDLTPSTPASGGLASGEWAVADVTASTAGLVGNLSSGTTIEVSNGPVGVSTTARVTFEEVSGGTEVEKTDDFRARVIEALGTDYGMFSAKEIKIVAKIVPGVTRVWVTEATLGGTNGVYEGQVKIAFLRDNDANPFPSAQEIAAVKAIIVDNILPAHTAHEDVMVQSPDPRPIGFTFTSLTPDTASMRLAILASLRQFFREAVDYGTDISEDAYRCAIFDTYDREGQQKLKRFTLSAPDGDIDIDRNEVPTLGVVTFPNGTTPDPVDPEDDGFDGGSP